MRGAFQLGLSTLIRSENAGVKIPQRHARVTCLRKYVRVANRLNCVSRSLRGNAERSLRGVQTNLQVPVVIKPEQCESGVATARSEFFLGCIHLIVKSIKLSIFLRYQCLVLGNADLRKSVDQFIYRHSGEFLFQ